MGISIRDRDIDKELEKLVTTLKTRLGIRNVSKTDAIRYLLEMKKQGKKTHRKWEKQF